jgi:hypothetical protein
MEIDDAAYEYIMSLPPILRNRPPGLDKILDEKDRFLYDVQSRPNEADLDAYNRMPLEEFGFAMLRGMGWTEGMPIGKNAQHVVPVIQFIRQPPRVGLGAVVRLQEIKRPDGWIMKPGESRDPPPILALPKDSEGRVRHWKTIDEQLKPIKEPFSLGSRLYITGGVHSGISGRTMMKQGDNVVVLLPSDERVAVNIKDLKELEENEPLPILPNPPAEINSVLSNPASTGAGKLTVIPAVIEAGGAGSMESVDGNAGSVVAAIGSGSAAPSSRKKSKKHKSKDKHKKKRTRKEKITDIKSEKDYLFHPPRNPIRRRSQTPHRVNSTQPAIPVTPPFLPPSFIKNSVGSLRTFASKFVQNPFRKAGIIVNSVGLLMYYRKTAVWCV